MILPDAISAWCKRLPKANVTDWGRFYDTPGASHQEDIRQSLADSGIPTEFQKLLDVLMVNSHEKCWPEGLRTKVERIKRRDQFKQYVLRRVPGKQAVVVMACENEHMSNDMIFKPGFVMIFREGVSDLE